MQSSGIADNKFNSTALQAILYFKQSTFLLTIISLQQKVTFLLPE